MTGTYSWSSITGALLYSWLLLLTYCVFYDFAGEYAGYLNAFPCYIPGEAFFRNLPVEPRTAAVPRPFSRRYFEVAGGRGIV